MARARKSKSAASLSELLDDSDRPVYAVDSRRRIVYCNAALATWIDLEQKQIVGREVEYHSEPATDTTDAVASGTVSALCPPPRAIGGEACHGTVSAAGRDGRLVHRHAEFIPLSADDGGVLVLLAAADMTPQELATQISGEPAADELHRTIRRFRRSQAARYTVPSLLGDSSPMQKLRAQVTAAAASGANVLVVGPPGSGRAQVARVIHYGASSDARATFIPIDCRFLNDDLLQRTLESFRGQRTDARQRPTLLLDNLERLAARYQTRFVEVLCQNALPVRVIATLNPAARDADDAPLEIVPALLDALSTITIRVPRLIDRLDDLPIIAHSLVEANNRANVKQVGSIRSEALDALALYNWPGELDELRGVITAAHLKATTSEITVRDLPPLIHHATSAASTANRHTPEPIVLDELLAAIEKQLIERALAQVAGNKTEAAERLGMTRPRLYRRLVQLGLVTEKAADAEDSQPEFIERDAAETEP